MSCHRGSSQPRHTGDTDVPHPQHYGTFTGGNHEIGNRPPQNRVMTSQTTSRIIELDSPSPQPRSQPQMPPQSINTPRVNRKRSITRSEDNISLHRNKRHQSNTIVATPTRCAKRSSSTHRSSKVRRRFKIEMPGSISSNDSAHHARRAVEKFASLACRVADTPNIASDSSNKPPSGSGRSSPIAPSEHGDTDTMYQTANTSDHADASITSIASNALNASNTPNTPNAPPDAPNKPPSGNGRFSLFTSSDQDDTDTIYPADSASSIIHLPSSPQTVIHNIPSSPTRSPFYPWTNLERRPLLPELSPQVSPHFIQFGSSPPNQDSPRPEAFPALGSEAYVDTYNEPEDVEASGGTWRRRFDLGTMSAQAQGEVWGNTDPWMAGYLFAVFVVGVGGGGIFLVWALLHQDGWYLGSRG